MEIVAPLALSAAALSGVLAGILGRLVVRRRRYRRDVLQRLAQVTAGRPHPSAVAHGAAGSSKPFGRRAGGELRRGSLAV